MFDVAGVPVASPGRIDKNPLVVGPTTVTFNTTDVAEAGTTSALTGAVLPGGCVATVPVTWSFWATPDTKGPGRPTSVRVSKMRVGVTATNDDGAEEEALTATIEPAPIVTATAAPTAAHRDRHIPDRARRSCVITPLLPQVAHTAYHIGACSSITCAERRESGDRGQASESSGERGDGHGDRRCREHGEAHRLQVTEDDEPYELRVTGPAQRHLGRLTEGTAAAIVEFMLGALVEDPIASAGVYSGELAGLHSARREAIA